MGYSDARVAVVRIPTKSKVEEVLGLPDQPVEQGWRVDGTQPFSPTDQAARFRRGPRWADNSCAVDAVLMIALFLEAGRCRVDQVWEGFLRRGNRAAHTLLGVIRKPWSRLQPDDIDQLRDLLRVELQKLNPQHHTIGKFQAVSTVLDDLAACVPQLHATWGTVVRCCPEGSWQWRLNQDGSLRQVCVLGLQATLEQEARMQGATDTQHAVQILLDPNPDATSIARKYAGRCTACTRADGPRQCQRKQVIIDRPPPTLVLKKTFEMTSGTGFLKGLCEDLTLDFAVLGRTGLDLLKTQYCFWGCILFQGGNHFAVGINLAARLGGSKLVLYESMRDQGMVTPVHGSWEDFLRRGKYGMSMPIYVRKS